VRRGVGHLLCDNDVYFLEPHQEAGYFLNKHMGDFPEIRPTGPSRFGIGEKHIRVVNCPENILQCKYTGQLLSAHPEWLDPKEAESTAIVLADESLLIPTLNALPDTTEPYSVNITMGYSYSNSMVHALIGRLFALYRQQDTRGYYHSTLTELFSDRFVGGLLKVSNLRHSSERLMRRDSRIRCSSADIEVLLREAGAEGPTKLLYLFPDHNPTPAECLVIFRQLVTDLVGSDLLEKNLKEKQAVGSLAKILENLSLLMDTYPFVTSTETMEKIYTRIAQRHAISLRGEPLQGLQILGMLETRNLDFKRVILLSANEGVLPSGRGDNTLIPNELKVHFGLPTYVEKDNIYAHHFYRLLQRAEQVYLLYNSENDGLGKGEASRFIRQIENELAPKFNIPVTQVSVKADATLTIGQPMPEVIKTDAIMRRLREMGQSGLSPTSFVDYTECPLKYYYSRVLAIDEQEEMDEDLDASQLGDCIHKVLEDIFKPHCGEPLKQEVLKEALEHLPTYMEQAFKELYSGGRNTEGRNRFLYSVAEAQLRHILRNEMSHLAHGERLTINSVEEKISGHQILDGVTIKGKIDRVDTLDGCLRIIDYKTGKLEKKEITYHDGDEQMPGKWLQLMWYALLYSRKPLSTFHPSLSTLKVGIYPLRNLRSDVKMATWNDSEEITAEQLKSFESLLQKKVEELMNPALPFTATPSSRACAYCPAKNFCNFCTK
jgi:RecB family exonuclease